MGRNVFWATVHDGKRYRTFHLLSAGLGGKHPKSGGKSASHTEQMWSVLVKRGFIKQYLKLKNAAKVQAIYSRNQACNKSPGNPNGCRSIQAGQMGMDKNTEFHYSSDYATGKKNTPITLNQMQNLDDGDRDYDSDDEYVDTDKFRGKDLDKITFTDFKNAVTHNPNF
jgi:hypothetical protein